LVISNPTIGQTIYPEYSAVSPVSPPATTLPQEAVDYSRTGSNSYEYARDVRPAHYEVPAPVEVALQYDDPTPVTPPSPIIDEEPPAGLRRCGFFQDVHFDATWLSEGAGPVPLGIADLELYGTLAMRSPVPQSVLLLRPGVGVHFFDNPAGLDLPDQVYDAYLNTILKGQFNDRWSYNLQLSLGVFSDFDNSSEDQFRIRGHGIGIWKWTPYVDLVFGAAYTDLEDWQVLPVGGLIWQPHEAKRYEILFPRARFAHRFYKDSPRKSAPEYWAYLGLELAGGTWTIRRVDDSANTISYSDWRFFLGIERMIQRNLTLDFEVGYVFSRKLNYEDGGPEIYPENTLMLRMLTLY